MKWPAIFVNLWWAAAAVLISWKGENVILAAILGMTIVGYAHMNKILEWYGKSNKQKSESSSEAKQA